MLRMLFSLFFATLAAFGQQVIAQPKLTEGVRPLRASHGDKHLPIGTQVWANIGDTVCAYPFLDSRPHRPDISNNCFHPTDKTYYSETWRRAKITGYAKAFRAGKRIDLYVIEFLPPPKDGQDRGNGSWFVGRDPENEPLTHNAVIEGEAFKMINVFDRRSEWSIYVITLNW